MVTSDSLRQFSSDCSSWARQIRNPSDRHTILRIAQSWQRTAEARAFDTGRAVLRERRWTGPLRFELG